MLDFFKFYFASLFLIKAFGIGEEEKPQPEEKKRNEKYRCKGFLKGYF